MQMEQLTFGQKFGHFLFCHGLAQIGTDPSVIIRETHAPQAVQVSVAKNTMSELRSELRNRA
jgi:hypothetical protein